MANSHHVKINLIGKPKESLVAPFLHWAVTAGRVIIVLTELIALAALIYRFTLDRQIIDLHDQIDRANLFVKAQAKKEADYRNIQDRLKNISTIGTETNKKINIMNQILDSISSGNFSATNLTISERAININGLAFSIFPINSFIETMKENPLVTSISLDEVSSTAQGIQFRMSLELAGKTENTDATNQKKPEEKDEI